MNSTRTKGKPVSGSHHDSIMIPNGGRKKHFAFARNARPSPHRELKLEHSDKIYATFGHTPRHRAPKVPRVAYPITSRRTHATKPPTDVPNCGTRIIFSPRSSSTTQPLPTSSTSSTPHLSLRPHRPEHEFVFFDLSHRGLRVSQKQLRIAWDGPGEDVLFSRLRLCQPVRGGGVCQTNGAQPPPPRVLGELEKGGVAPDHFGGTDHARRGRCRR